MGAKEQMHYLFCHIHVPEGIADSEDNLSNTAEKLRRTGG